MENIPLTEFQETPNRNIDEEIKKKLKKKHSRVSVRIKIYFNLFLIPILLITVSLIAFIMTSVFITIISKPKQEFNNSTISSYIHQKSKEDLEISAYISYCPWKISENKICDFPIDWHPCGKKCSNIQYIASVLIDVCCIVIGVISISSWVISESITSFNQFGIFIIVCLLIMQTFTFSIMDFAGAKNILAIGEDLGIMEASSLNQVIVKILVVIIYIQVMMCFMWIIFSLINILLKVIFPMKFANRRNRKIKRLIAVGEIFVSICCCIIMLLIASVTSIKFEYYPFSESIISKHELLTDSSFVSMIIYFVIAFTTAILIPCALRIYNIQAKDLSKPIRKLKLVEKKLITFALILTPYIIVNHWLSIWFSYTIEYWTTSVHDNLLCKQMLTPVYPPDRTVGDLVYGVDWNEGEICRSIRSYEELYPSVLFLFAVINKRQMVLIGFLLTLPSGVVKKIKQRIRGTCRKNKATAHTA